MKYKGFHIYECERIKGEHAGRWVVQTFHEATGIAWSDDQCPHFQTLKDAREGINQLLAMKER